MGLWLEHRDDKGTLIERSRFLNGSVTMVQLAEIYGDGSTSAAVFSLKEAVALAKMSSHLPVEKRDWVLRVGLADED
jgi:hypothetical protein